ncbi:MAG TPA: GNAT family N-acetyltransferase [Rhizomicrobium sp.]|nr:GNAT family N-acetyltransferase [Rhizomicrobium sp.]
MFTTQVREARLPADKPAILEFIMALQRYESLLEPNRRYDLAMAEEYFDTLVERARRGRIFVAEDGGRPVGWTIVYEEETEAFIRDDERRFAYLAELYVSEAYRGSGIAYDLIDACEDWARGAGYSTMRIDLLSRNLRAARAYEKAGYAPYCQEVRKRLLPAKAEQAEDAEVIPFKAVRRRFPMMAAE